MSIRQWPKDDRPREKLLKFGEHRLSDSELLAILLRTGQKGESAVELARTIMDKFKTFRNMGHTDLRRWLEVKGLGPAKIAQIKAALEIARRYGEEKVEETRPRVRSSKDAAELVMPRMRDLKKEVFKVLLLNSQNRVIDIIEIEEGTVNYASPVIREIFQTALQHFAAAVICVHNHPSGIAEPSAEDRVFTERLKEAGLVMQIRVLDHIIIGNETYYSFEDQKTVV